MFGLKQTIRTCYKLNKLHMIVAPPMTNKNVRFDMRINIVYSFLHIFKKSLPTQNAT